MKNTLKAAICGISSALSVLLLFFGGASFVFAYIMPMVTGLIMIVLKRACGTPWAVTAFISVSFLSFMLVADRECVLMYILFFGYYPILHSSIEKIGSRLIKWIAKLSVFNVMITIVQLLLVYIFGIPFLEEGTGKIFVPVFALLMNIMFIIYDMLINRLTLLYKFKLEKRIKKYFK
ncbi:MAG: hypothetical protein K2G73_04825 [Eubacterium sp.]|nr:hypothetical protein [Eubacterium sp.]